MALTAGGRSKCPRCHGCGAYVVRKCERCRGEGRIERRHTVRVQMPRGVKDQAWVRVEGGGHAGTVGAAPGDLYVKWYVSLQHTMNLWEKGGGDPGVDGCFVGQSASLS